MLKGLAIGGPRDKSKILAPASWDGRVARSGSGSRSLYYKPEFFPGRYVWYEGTSEWRWETGRV